MPAGRPLSPEARAIRDYLHGVRASAGVTVRTISRDLRISPGQAHKLIDRLVARTEAQVVGRRQVEGVCKPVCVYAAPTAVRAVPMFDLLSRGFGRGTAA